MNAITLHADDFTLGPFQDEFGHIGTMNEIRHDGRLFIIDFPGFKNWVARSKKFSPYSYPSEFIPDGIEEWINQGYSYAFMLRKILPPNIDVFYGFWKNFGDNNWQYCKTYIPIRVNEKLKTTNV